LTYDDTTRREDDDDDDDDRRENGVIFKVGGLGASEGLYALYLFWKGGSGWVVIHHHIMVYQFVSQPCTVELFWIATLLYIKGASHLHIIIRKRKKREKQGIVT
jgi:hypothetical protein